jgi:nitrous oxidase accessory protein
MGLIRQLSLVFFILSAVGSRQTASGAISPANGQRSPANDTLMVCKGCDHASITSAIESAHPGDVIQVMPGEYREGTIEVSKPLTLMGKGQPEVFGHDGGDVFVLDADYITVKGFVVRDVGISYVKDLAGIKVNERKHCRIENNRLLNTFFGIYLRYADSCVVTGNEITGQAKDEISSGNAIHLWYSKNIVLTGNSCLGHRDGIYLEFVENSMISHNISRGNVRYGLHFMFSNHDEYTGNTFEHNGAGVAVMFSRFIIMRDNIFEHNWGPSSYGLLLKDIFDGEITGNTFRQNTIGIYGDGSNRIHIHGNHFTGNGWALKILGSCSANIITGNNFEGNTFDVITNTSSNTNTYTGNYWSDYTGYDLDHDGTGDVPHYPVKLFSYIVGNVPSSIILLRSFFVDLVDFAEKVAPSITPQALVDPLPLIRRINL